MANNLLKSVTYSGETNYSVADSDVVVYTVPASTTTILLGLTVSNVLNELITVSVKIKDDDAGQTVKYLHAIPINQGASLEAFSTKLILNEADELILSSGSGNSFDVIASLVEQT
jgi:hypothetical protein